MSSSQVTSGSGTAAAGPTVVVAQSSPKKDLDTGDCKTVAMSGNAFPMTKHLRAAALKGQKNLTVNISTLGANSASAGANAAQYITIDPTGSSQFVNFGSLFDEYRVRSVTLKWAINLGALTASSAAASVCVVVYDPLVSTVLGSSLEGVQFGQKQVVFAGGTTAGYGFVLPLPETKDGFWTFTPKMLKGVVQTLSTSSASYDMWQSCTNSTKLPYGYFKYFVPSFWAAAVTVFQYWMEMMVDFRFRAD